MSRFRVLPTPLSSGSIVLGQLTTDPIRPDTLSFTPSSKPQCKQPHLHSNYQSAISHDTYGHFLPTTFSPSRSPITVTAEESSHTTLTSPRPTFNSLRHDLDTQTFLRKSAQQHQTLYYVTGIQTLKNPSFQRPGIEHGSVAEAPAIELRLPMHVRRVDSAFGLDNTKVREDDGKDEVIFAVELVKVRCRVGAADEPHEVGDVEYEWSYHKLDDEEGMQLSIGLGKTLEAAEFREMAGVRDRDEEYVQYNWDYGTDDEDGLGGF